MSFLRKKTHGRSLSRSETSFTWQLVIGFGKLLLVVTAFTLIWYITRLPVFTIDAITVEGGETIAHDLVRSRIEDALSGAYLLLIPRRFTYLYPEENIKDSVDAIPRIHSVSMSKPERRALIVSFKEYVPHALWCGETTRNSCWFLDSTGYAFAEAPQLLGGSLVRHTIEGMDEADEGAVIETSKLASLDTFIGRASEELGFRITEVMYKRNGDIELLIHGGGKILIASGKDMKATFENLKSVLSADEFSDLRPGNFRYVDVRFANKVFVNEELSTTTSTSSEPLPE